MKNLYAILGTHILTDGQTLKKILDFKIQQNALDEKTIAQIRHYLLNADNRAKYDQKLQQIYPNLLSQAQSIIEKSQQRKQTQITTPSVKPQSHTKNPALPKLLIGLFLGFLSVIGGYWGYQQWKKPYTKLIINTPYQTDLDPAFKKKLLTQTKTYGYPDDISFNEADGLLAFSQDGQSFIWKNSNNPQDNVWQNALASTEALAKTGLVPRWLPNQRVLDFNGEYFATLNPGMGLSIKDNPNPPKVPPSTNLTTTSSNARSSDGKYMMVFDYKPNSDMMIVNTLTQKGFVKKSQNHFCMIFRARFSPDNNYLVTTLPTTNIPNVNECLFRIKTDMNGDVVDLEEIALIDAIDRKRSAIPNSKFITNDNVFFFKNSLATINNNGDLRYWDLATGKMLSEIKLDYHPGWEAQFSSDGRYLWYPTKTEVHVFDLKTGKDHYISQNKASNNQIPTPLVIGNKNLWLRNTTSATSDMLTVNF